MLQTFVLQKKGIATAAGTLTCALAIGFVMQSTDTAQQRYGVAGNAIPMVKTIDASDPANSLLDVQAIKLTSAEFSSGIEVPQSDPEVVKVASPKSVLPEPVLPTMEIADACTISAVAQPIAAAMVKLSMEAPCLPNERVTVHHNGMIFTETTTFNGTLDLTVPALATDAVFIMAFTNGDGAVAQTMVEDLADFDRSVLQWKGNTGFQIHAREFGAGYGETGHLWESAPGEIADAVTGNGGVLTRHDPAVDDGYDAIGRVHIGGDHRCAVDHDRAVSGHDHVHGVALQGGQVIRAWRRACGHVFTLDHMIGQDRGQLIAVFRLQQRVERVRAHSGERVIGRGEDGEGAVAGQRVDQLGGLQRSHQRGEAFVTGGDRHDGRLAGMVIFGHFGGGSGAGVDRHGRGGEGGAQSGGGQSSQSTHVCLP